MKLPVKILIACMMGLWIILAAGCGQTSDSGIVLSKPSYAGETDKGKPEFRLKWTRYPDAGGYEIAIYAEGEDPYGRGPFAIRSVKNIYQNKTSGSLVFLRGVYTDTVTYRVKVRPIVAVDSLKDSSNDIWSNIWEIRFTGGEYELASTENDFDEVYGQAGTDGQDVNGDQGVNGDQAGSGNQAGNSASGPADLDLSAGNSQGEGESAINQDGVQHSGDQIDPALRHVFPENLTEYLAKEAGKAEGLELSGIRSLSTGVDDTTYGEPRQKSITNQEVIKLFTDALSGIQVSEKVDDITDNKTSFFYSAQDADGKEILKFSICDGMLVGKDGRYSLVGLDALTNVKGIISTEGWTNFLKDQAAKADNYDEKKTITGASLTDAVGYNTSLMASKAPDGLIYMGGRIDSKEDTEAIRLDGDKDMKKIWKALSAVKIGQEKKKPSGESWHLVFRFNGEHVNFCESARISFTGSNVRIGNSYYQTEGLEALYDAVPCEMFTYLKEFGKAKKIKPVY